MKISNFLIPQDSSDSSPHSNSPESFSLDLCSFPSSSSSPSTTKKKHIGRKINSDTEILSHFYTFRASSTGQPKKEYLRCKLIRGHKKANRQIEKNIIPIKSFNSYNYHNPQSIALWNKLSEIYKNYSFILKDLSRTENTIIASKKKNKLKTPSLTKSFNACFCTEYFQRLEVRESFYYYVEYLFSDFEPNVLCRKFNFNCCKSQKHNEICYEKWEKVKQYINNEMILELKLEPWFPNCEKILDEPRIEEAEKKSPELYLDFNQPSWIRKIYVQKIELINPSDIFKVNIIRDLKV
ncbi:unnamed protein product [Blepharisma stoltei]|uniref:Uncharacterized protein n=1 Tax=Blepharisma stoltei TaxID=1481888 RepID=A0AAU9J4I0_9CILI|nr:unnamed protein product [Blepharisma stoltei]